MCMIEVISMSSTKALRFRKTTGQDNETQKLRVKIVNSANNLTPSDYCISPLSNSNTFNGPME